MTRKSRYLLLLFGFLIFIVVAPAVVLYVRGETFDFKTRSFVQTGILAVRTDPSSVNVYLNGKLKQTKAGDIKFLAPGSYDVSLKQNGYFDWHKRLNVLAGQVAWASPPYGQITLLLKNPAAQTLTDGVVDFFSGGNNLAYLKNNSFYFAPLSHPSSAQSFPLPGPVNKILAVDDSGKNFILSNSSTTSTAPVILIFNSDTATFTDLSALLPDSTKIEFQGQQLLALMGTNLYQVNPEAKTKSLLISGVKAFTLQNGSLYYVRQVSNEFQLLASQQPFDQNQLLIGDLPVFQKGDLFVTFGKQIFLLADGQLYQAGSNMQKIIDGVSQISQDLQNSNLMVFHSGEFDYYDSGSQNLSFITRSGQTIASLAVKNSIGYAFYSAGNQVTAIELDTRDNQNQYDLYDGANLQKFAVDDSGGNILLLDNGQLKTLTIR